MVFRAFPNDDSEEKPTLESFGVTGDRSVHSFDDIISKIEEIEKRVSDRWYGTSNDGLDNFRLHKDSLIRMLTSHEVHVYMSVCLYLSACPVWCMSVSQCVYLLTTYCRYISFSVLTRTALVVILCENFFMQMKQFRLNRKMYFGLDFDFNLWRGFICFRTLSFLIHLMTL